MDTCGAHCQAAVEEILWLREEEDFGFERNDGPRDEEILMVDFIDDGPRREAPHLDVCWVCPNASQFEQMTSIGMHHFCSEKCFAEATGLPVYEEGYYGLGQPKIPAPAPTSMAEALAVVEGSYSVSAVMSGSQPNNPKKEE